MANLESGNPLVDSGDSTDAETQGPLIHGTTGVPGTAQPVLVDSDGHFQVDVLSSSGFVVTNAIDSAAFDLNAGAFSSTTSISNDYLLSRLELNFSTIESRDITITTSDGTELYKTTSDTSLDIHIDFEEAGFNSGENITVDITQTAGACLVDVILTVLEGSQTLLGNPTVIIQQNTNNFKTAEDTNFVTGDSPVDVDMNTGLGENARDVIVINDGPGDFTVASSNDGSTFGDAFTMSSGEQINLSDVSIDTLRITWVSDSAYRILYL